MMPPKRPTTWQHFCGFCCGIKKWALENQKLVLWGAGLLLPLLGVGGTLGVAKTMQAPAAQPVVVFPDSTVRMFNDILTATKEVKAELANLKTETNTRLGGLEYGQSRFARIVAKSEILRRAERQVQEDEETEQRFRPRRSSADTLRAPEVAGPNWRPPGRSY